MLALSDGSYIFLLGPNVVQYLKKPEAYPRGCVIGINVISDTQRVPWTSSKLRGRAFQARTGTLECRIVAALLILTT